MAKLTAAEVRGLIKKPGKYGDGNGLTLVVATAERGSWVFRYMLKGRAREMSLGNAERVSLAEARERAVDARKLLRSGTDPLDQRRAKEVEAETAKAHATTFMEAAADYIAAHELSWRSPVHRAQWKSTLATYAEPVIGALPVGDIATDQILAVLKPIWVTKPDSRLCQGARLARSRSIQPGHVARPSAIDAPGNGQGAKGRTSRCAGLAQGTRLYARASSARQLRRPCP
jgi:hypothetical protein